MRWRRKPAGWPAYFVTKRLSRGRMGYYWQPPSWARRSGCPFHSEPLGTDFARAKIRCDEVLNPQFEAWRKTGNPSASRSLVGTFDWMVEQYRHRRNGCNSLPERESTTIEFSRWSLSTNLRTVAYSVSCPSKA